MSREYVTQLKLIRTKEGWEERLKDEDYIRKRISYKMESTRQQKLGRRERKDILLWDFETYNSVFPE